jgi:hypothetical protein
MKRPCLEPTSSEGETLEWITWVLCWKKSPYIRKFLNKDVAVLVAQYLQQDLIKCHTCYEKVREDAVFTCELCWDFHCVMHMYVDDQGDDPRVYCEGCGDCLAENGYFGSSSSESSTPE